MADFSLTAVFGMDATGVRTEIKQLRKDFAAFADSVASLGIGAVTAAFVALSKGAVELAGRLADTAVNVGINVESLQALEAQHKRNGVPAEQLTKALEKIRAGVQAAREGDEKAVITLAKLGLKWQDLAALPLEKKYERIARAQLNAKDKSEAYSAICDLFGEKVGPRLMGSLNELAQDGFPAIAAASKKNGQIMAAETIVALDRAGDAIDDFKKKATVAIGSIIVNFRSEEGIKLLGMQFLRVAGAFGAGIGDAIYEGGELILAVFYGAIKGTINYFRDGFLDAIGFLAEQFNSIIPDFLKKRGFTIDVASIDALKSAGKSIGDEITDAIAHTSPSTFKKDISEYWDKQIADQQKVVDALNKKDLKKDADGLRNAGKDIEQSLKNGAKAVGDQGKSAGDDIAKGGKEASEHIKSALELLLEAIAAGKFTTLGRVGTDYSQQSTEALKGVQSRLKPMLEELDRDISYQSAFSPEAKNPMFYAVKSELAAVEKELSERYAVAGFAAKNGEDAARFKFGDDATNKAIQDLSKDTTRTATGVEGIRQRLDQLLGK